MSFQAFRCIIGFRAASVCALLATALLEFFLTSAATRIIASDFRSIANDRFQLFVAMTTARAVHMVTVVMIVIGVLLNGLFFLIFSFHSSSSL